MSYTLGDVNITIPPINSGTVDEQLRAAKTAAQAQQAAEQKRLSDLALARAKAATLTAQKAKAAADAAAQKAKADAVARAQALTAKQVADQVAADAAAQKAKADAIDKAKTLVTKQQETKEKKDQFVAPAAKTDSSSLATAVKVGAVVGIGWAIVRRLRRKKATS